MVSRPYGIRAYAGSGTVPECSRRGPTMIGFGDRLPMVRKRRMNSIVITSEASPRQHQPLGSIFTRKGKK